MRINIVSGGGFRGTLDYAMSPGKGLDGRQPEVIAGTMNGANPRDLAHEFSQSRALRPDISKPVAHIQLAAHPEDGRLTDAQWEQAAEIYMKEAGFPADTQWCAVRHGDTKHDHIHIVASRVDGMGKRFDATDDRIKAQAAARKIEQRLGLRDCAPKPSAEAGMKVAKGEIEAAKRTGQPIPKVEIARGLESALREKPTDLRDLQNKMAQRGVTMTAHTHPETGAVRGLSFEKDGHKFSGSQLSRRASFKNVADRLADKGKGPNSQPGALLGSRPAGRPYAQPAEQPVADQTEGAGGLGGLDGQSRAEDQADEGAEIYEGMGEVAYSRATAAAAARRAARIDQEHKQQLEVTAALRAAMEGGGMPPPVEQDFGGVLRGLANQQRPQTSIAPASGPAPGV